MHFIIDENLPRSFAGTLRELGHAAEHVSEIGLEETDDKIIVAVGRQAGKIIITFDLDFSRIVAVGRLDLPSVITFRVGTLTKAFFQEIMMGQLPQLEDSLAAGALVTIDERRIRVQKLPVR